MSHIDERIVKMTFDNSSFEKGVSKTLQSLEKLNEVLKNTGNTDAVNGLSKSMKDIQSQLSSLNFDELNNITQKQSMWQKFGSVLSGVGHGIGTIFNKLDIGGTISKLGASFSQATEGSSTLERSVESVSKGFTALGVIGATALANITNKAVNAGTSLLKALTIDPIKTGFSEYETKMGAIQTILTNTAHQGTKLEDVNKALNELNTYADKTIYNFAEMTKNIGTFTAAGIDLDTSKEAIKGIANLAAASGSTSTQASTAMYQLSQALAAGKVSLQDWNSVVNAGMGGKMFQDALIRTSKIMGTGAEEAIEKYGSFRESLTKGQWLTSEVLTETLKQIAGAYTEADLISQGYSKSQAKQILEMAKNAEAAATEVKTFTQLMDTMKESVQSGWAQSWEYIIGDKEQATKFFTGISKAFEEIIKPSVDARNEMLKFWNEAGGRDDVIKGLGNIFKSLGKVMGSIGEAWKDVFPPMTGEKLVELSNKFKDFTEKIKINDETAKKIKNTFKGIFDVFDVVKDSVVQLASGFTPLLGIFKAIGGVALDVASGIGKLATSMAEGIRNSDVFGMISSGIKTSLTWVQEFISGIGSAISTLFGYLGNLDFGKAFDFIGKGLGGIGTVLQPVIDGIGKALGSIDFGTIMDAAKTGTFLKVLSTLKDTFDEIGGVADSAKDVFGSLKGIGSKITDTLGAVKESLETWQQDLQASTLMKIAGAIALLAASLIIISSIDGKSLAKSLVGMGVIFAELAGAYMAISKVGGLKSGIGVSASLIAMASAMLILAGALKLLSTINIGEMITGVIGLAAVMGTMMIAVKAFDGKHKNLSKTASGLIIFGVALMTMAGALKLLGSIDAETLGGGLFALAGVLMELAAFLAVAKYGNLSVTTATGVLVLAGALLVLQRALDLFGNIKKDVILTGLAAMTGVLAIVTLFSKFNSSGSTMITTATGLAAMSAAMLVMSVSLKSLGSIEWETIGRGLVAMAGGLTVLGVAAALMSGGKLILLGVGIAAMSAALLVMSAALQSLGGMSWGEIGKSLVALAGALTILAVAMYAMTGAIVGAAAMVVMAGALAILTPQLLLLGQMSLSGVGIMLLALAGAFTILGVAGLLLTPVIPALIGLAAAIALLGVGCIACGVGLTAVGTGLGLITAAIGGGGLLIVEFLRQLINLLPQIATKAAEAFAAFVAALATSLPQLVTGFTAILTAMLTAIGTLIPQIVQTAIDIVVAFAQGLATAVPQLVTAGMELIVGVLEGIAANIEQVVTAGADIVINFMDGIAAKLPEIIESGINLALSFIEGVADGISNNKDRIEAAVEKAITAMIDAALAVITGSVTAIKEKGREFLQGMVDGIKEKWEAAKKAVSDAIDKAKEGAKNCGKKLLQAGKDLINGFIDGIEEKIEAAKKAIGDGVQACVDKAKAVLGIKSPSRVFMEIGRYTAEGFAVGLDRTAGRASDSAANLANSVIDNVKEPLSNLSKILDLGINTDPVIRPVMDLSNVKQGARMLDGMLQNNDMQINGISGTLAGTIGTIQNGNDNSDIVTALKDLKDSLGNNGPSYTINGITYDDGSNVVNAVETLVRAARIERRI